MILVSWHHLGVIVIFIYPHILTYSLAKYLSIHNAKACFSSKRNIETHKKGKSMKQHICQEQHPRRFFRNRNTFGASESACTGKSGSPWAMEPCRPWPRAVQVSEILGRSGYHAATVPRCEWWLDLLQHMGTVVDLRIFKGNHPRLWPQNSGQWIIVSYPDGCMDRWIG